MPPVFAQNHGGGFLEWDVGHAVKVVIVVACLLGVLLIALRVAGIEIPRWAWQIAGLCLLAFVAILAVNFLMGL